MPPRRRISRIVEQQQRLREIGRIRFGERKAPNRPGRPIDFPRVTSLDRKVIEQVAAAYGGTVEEWPREDGPAEWEVHVAGPLAIAVPPFIECWSMAFEQWQGGINTVRCDGETCQFRKGGKWVERPCVCAARDQDYIERPCKATTRMIVAVLGVPTLGLWRVDTKSYNAASEVPATLELLQATGRAGWLRMEDRTDKAMVWNERKGEDVPTTRRFKVISVDADFHPDELMRIERAPSMAALPAPARPREIAGLIDPSPPQPGDRVPPPREVPPVPLEMALPLPVSAPVDEDGEPLSGDVVEDGPRRDPDDERPAGPAPKVKP